MKHFSLYNLTDTVIEVSTDAVGRRAGLHPAPHGNSSGLQVLVGPNTSSKVLSGTTIHLSSIDIEGATRTHRATIPGFWAKRGASWKVVSLDNEEACPWKAYWLWQGPTLVVIPRRNMASFLGDMPDSLSLASLMLPGTHDTMAFYGWPISQCQSLSTPLDRQFVDGIRVIDVRLAVVPVKPIRTKTGAGIPFAPGSMVDAKAAALSEGAVLPTPEFKLIAYHGIYPQRTPFTTILETIHSYLTSPAGCRETLIMSIKQEDFTVSPPTLFSRLVREEIQRSPGAFKDTDEKGDRDLGMWFLENRIPTLGEVRGKCVLLSRFGVNGEEWEGGWEGLGIHPLRWPNSEKKGFVWNLKGTTIRTHDWYAIPSFLSIPEKTALSTMVLDSEVVFPLQMPQLPAGEGKKEGLEQDPILNISYLSAATFPLALPPTVAKGAGWPGFKLGFEGVNARVGRWLLEELVPDLKNSSKLHQGNFMPVQDGHNDGRVRQREKLQKIGWFRPKNTGRNSYDQALLRHGNAEESNSTTLAEAKRLRGWALLDYYSSEKDLLPLLVEFNYRGRKEGEEGWR